MIHTPIILSYRIAGTFEGENFHESMKYKISRGKLSWIHHRPDIVCNKPKVGHAHFRGENFHKWHQICEIRETFPQKFPAIRY